MKCYECKKEIPQDAVYCPKCSAPQQFTDELIQKAAYDQSAFQQLYNMTKDNVYYTIKALIDDEDIVQDLTQDTYVKAANALSQLKEPAAFRGWIKTIARNLAIDVLRRQKTVAFSELVPVDSDEAIEIEDKRVDSMPEAVMERQETTRLIGELLGTLPEDQRAAVVLHYMQQMSIKEIAEMFQVSENTVKSRLNYGRKKVEAEVLKLEKKGTKLYSLAPIMFLLWLFRNAEAFPAELPDAEIVQAATAGMARAGNTAAGSAAGSVSAAGSTAAGAAAKGPAVAVKGLAAKIVASVAAAAILIGGGTAAYTALQNDRAEEHSEGSPAVTETGDKNTPGTVSDPKAMNEAAHEAYQTVLTRYRETIFVDYDTFVSNRQAYLEDILDESKMTDHRYYENEAGGGWLAEYYYCFMDIDQNGVDELLIGYGGTEPYEIIDVRYFDGETAQSVVEKLSDATSYLFWVYEDGTVNYNIDILVYEGAPHSLEGLLAFDGTGTDVQPVFAYERVMAGSSYYNDSETLSRAEFRALLDSHLPLVESFGWQPIEP